MFWSKKFLLLFNQEKFQILGRFRTWWGVKKCLHQFIQTRVKFDNLIYLPSRYIKTVNFINWHTHVNAFFHRKGYHVFFHTWYPLAIINQEYMFLVCHK